MVHGYRVSRGERIEHAAIMGCQVLPFPTKIRPFGRVQQDTPKCVGSWNVPHSRVARPLFGAPTQSLKHTHLEYNANRYYSFIVTAMWTAQHTPNFHMEDMWFWKPGKSFAKLSKSLIWGTSSRVGSGVRRCNLLWPTIHRGWPTYPLLLVRSALLFLDKSSWVMYDCVICKPSLKPQLQVD